MEPPSREIESQVLKSGELELILVSRLIDCGQDRRRREPILSGTSLAKDGVWSTFGFPPTSKVKRLTFLLRLVESDVKPDVPARVIINERTGTIVATQSVRISPVAVSSSNITIFLNPTTGVSQPLPFSAGATTILEGENAELIEEVGRFEALDELDLREPRP